MHWGCDYTQEVWEIEPEELLQFAEEREAQKNPLGYRWDPGQWNVYCVAGLTCFQFRSNVRTATEEEVQDNETYGVGRWRKLKGVATIRLTSGRIRIAELHWYEAHGIGRKEIKRKYYLD